MDHELEVKQSLKTSFTDHPWLVCVVVFLLYQITSSTWAYWRLRHIKGPPLAAWTSLWWIRAAVSTRANIYLYDAANKYGSIVRIGPNTLITTDLDLMRVMNSVRSPFVKSDWFKAFRFDADRENLFSETDEERHGRMRQKVAAGYSGKENPTLEPDIDATILQLVDLIKKKYISTSEKVIPMDFADKMQYLTLDIISKLSLGHAFGWVADDEDKYEYMATMKQNAPAMNFMSAVPILSRLLRVQAIQRMILPTVKDRIGMGKIKAVAHEMIAERFVPGGAEKTGRPNDMIQSFISHGLTQAEVADESLLQLLAGSDTSGTILRSAFVYIIPNQRIYSRLQQECRSTNVPLLEVIPYAKAQELPYLNACIKEALRYHPAASGITPRRVGPQGYTHNGIYLPPGTEVGVNTWNMQRHGEVYGSDASYFRPERWLEAGPERLAQMEKAHELNFGYGRYKCMGERIARIELAKIMFELARRYDFEFIDPMVPMESDNNYGLWLQKGMWLRVSEPGTL